MTSIDTRLARAGHFEDEATGALVPPLHTSTTFARDADYELKSGYIYGREATPTVSVAEALLRDLEGGAETFLFSSGLTATTSLLETLSAGDRVVAPTVMYHGTHDWLHRLSKRRGIDVAFFDASDPDGLDQALGDRGATFVWIETPVNPTWDVIDIRRAANEAHAAGAALVVDSTVAPPLTTRPLEMGADFVVHSATKYLNGHSDVLGGVVSAAEAGDRWEELTEVRKATGGILAPFDAWLLVRGLRTLAVRWDRCCATTLALAEHFEGHDRVVASLYPGLPSHPGHEIARSQMKRGFGGMWSLLIDGSGDDARRIATSLTCFTPATSLGGVESHVEHRASVEGPHSIVPENLLRFSIGLEDAGELIEDLERALAG